MVRDMEGKLEGRRMKFFDYTGKKLVGITEYRKLMKSEINRVANLPYDRRVTQGWAGEIKRPEGVLYEEDNLCHIPGVGERTQKKIEKIAGINSVMQMSCINDDHALSLSIMCSLNIDRIKHWCDLCQDMLPGKCKYPIPFDFVHGQTNPYIHRYGAEWETEINKVAQSGLTKVKCVTELIKHIKKETKMAFKNTKHVENDYWRRWVKPELGLNSVIQIIGEDGKSKVSRNYKERPVGDCPELMPHDSSLNWDVNTSLNMHCIFTSHLPNDDERKIAKTTTSLIVTAMTKFCDPITGVVPKPHRIVQDCQRVLYCLEEIVAAGGAVVPGLVNRNGHHALKGSGRKRYFPRHTNAEVRTLDDVGIVPEVQGVAKEFMHSETDRFKRGKNQSEMSDLE
jgi:hypothetical protein